MYVRRYENYLPLFLYQFLFLPFFLIPFPPFHSFFINSSFFLPLSIPLRLFVNSSSSFPLYLPSFVPLQLPVLFCFSHFSSFFSLSILLPFLYQFLFLSFFINISSFIYYMKYYYIHIIIFK